MFSFFKNKQSTTDKTDLSWIGTDMHSHFLPGIDDGAQDLTESLELIRGLAALGYKKIITTPHVLWEIYPNTADIIAQKKAEVVQTLTTEGLKIEFNAAAEYFIDEHFQEELRAKKPLLTLKDNLVLVEFSMVTAPLDLRETLFDLQLQNYQPIIAHPERYVYLRNNKEFFDDLKDSGCLLQLNLLSLTGHYGRTVQELAEYLIKKEYYSYAGTDMHNVRHLQALQKIGSSPLYTTLKESGQIKNHLL